MGCSVGKHVEPVQQNAARGDAHGNANGAANNTLSDDLKLAPEDMQRRDSGIPSSFGQEGNNDFAESMPKEQFDFFRMLDEKVDAGDDFNSQADTDSFQQRLEDARRLRKMTASQHSFENSRPPSIQEMTKKEFEDNHH